MAEVTVCGRCGTRSWAGVRFCYACGQSLIPNWPGNAPVAQVPGVQMPVGQVPVAPAPIMQVQPVAPAPFAAPAQYAAPAPFAAPQGAQPSGYSAGFSTASLFASISAKPVGLLFVAAVEIVIALVGFYVAYDLFTWVNWGINYGDGSEVPLDLVVGVAYFATSSLMFGAVRGLWSLRAWAWTRACLLNILLIGMIIASVIPWGLNTLDIIGLIANSVMLVCLNLTSTRKLFGRPPLSFLQAAQ